MTKLEIGIKNKILRTKSKEVKNVKNPKIQKLIDSMVKTLEQIEIGVGLAAPQIGKNWRIFVVSKIIAKEIIQDHQVFVNPKIITKSDQQAQFEEGCLSLPNIWGKIKRANKVKIGALDKNGKKFKIKAVGFIAQIFQHEIDHLNGILFVDNTIKIWKAKKPIKK